MRVSGCDISSEVVAQAENRLLLAGNDGQFYAHDILALEHQKNIADLVICCEVLEHTLNPQVCLKIISEITSRWVILSVPNEPWWRILNVCRLAYLKDWGNTPGHLWHWSPGLFRALVEEHLDIVEFRNVFPWTMLLAQKRALPSN
jgi:2-polyprenyl-3-methyl-5-hydroxy-6-metoxy-1,4-benzoquinol methylase